MGKICVVAGPTASGKTAVAVELAKLIGGEVISADSMQIYKGMDIGTAKPTAGERDNIPHHMIDIVNPDELYSAALYQKQTRDVINDVLARNRVPILCGGTGFYINAVLRDIDFAQDGDADPLRGYFSEIAAQKGLEYMHNLLQEIDPVAAEAIHPNNVKRVVRALSYCKETGQLFSQYNQTQKKQPDVYEAAFCCLKMDRELLYQRINQRVINMFAAGLEEEVAGLLAQGYGPSLVSMQGIGYKETVHFLQGGCTREEMVNIIQQNSRHYAKRQETWFRNQTPHAIYLQTSGGDAKEIAQEMGRCHF
ncbi:MAG: tRNA (adenosine(37)-N6)-dimethylallyltransferase MiaA [Defluviitaleaceae bacterium]|nr:tRNA (adenosine(37)-N6)-dimethylallyltransferase MiaA [Defluviitaleaceae bacterium]